MGFVEPERASVLDMFEKQEKLTNVMRTCLPYLGL